MFIVEVQLLHVSSSVVPVLMHLLKHLHLHGFCGSKIRDKRRMEMEFFWACFCLFHFLTKNLESICSPFARTCRSWMHGALFHRVLVLPCSRGDRLTVWSCHSSPTVWAPAEHRDGADRGDSLGSLASAPRTNATISYYILKRVWKVRTCPSFICGMTPSVS